MRICALAELASVSRFHPNFTPERRKRRRPAYTSPDVRALGGLTMRALGTITVLCSAAIAASAAVFACGSGDDVSVPVPHFDGSVEASPEASAESSSDATPDAPADAPADAPPEASSPDGGGG
jgi:hypothetical protein